MREGDENGGARVIPGSRGTRDVQRRNSETAWMINLGRTSTTSPLDNLEERRQSLLDRLEETRLGD